MIDVRTLRENELEAWFDHCMYVFNEGVYSSDYRQYFRNHWYNDPWRDIDSILVAVEEGQIISTVRIFHRNIFIRKEYVRLGGIGEVSTLPEYRGRGLANELLQQAVQMMEKADIKVSMLFGNKKIYEKLNWNRLPKHWRISTVDAECEFSYKIRSVDMDTDINAIRGIYGAYAENFNGPVTRECEEYWKLWFQQEKKNCSVILDSKGVVVAYGCFILHENQGIVEEFCTLPGYDGTFQCFASYISSLNGKSRCEIKYPAIIQTGLPTERMEEDTSAMIRLIRPFSLGENVINTTGQLIHSMSGDESEFFYFSTDGF